MRGKVHLAAGICAGAAGTAAIVMGHSTVAHFLFDGHGVGTGAAVIFGICTAFGSLFPDIDSPRSKIGRRVPLISTLINAAYGHRGIFHVPILYILAAVIVFLMHPSGFAYAAAVGFFYGVAIHIILDMMTRGGIMLFYPLKIRVRLTTARSGSILNIPCAITLVILLAGVWIAW